MTTSSLRQRLALLTSMFTACAMASIAHAGGTYRFTADSSDTFAGGELEAAAIRSDGVLESGTGFNTLSLPDAAIAYSLARRSDGALFVGTGSEGKIFRVTNKRSDEFARTDEVLVTALVAGDRNQLFAATLPGGKILRVDVNGKTSLLTTLPNEQHVWALHYDGKRHELLAATGPEGRLYAIDTTDGSSKVRFDSKQPNLISLCVRDGIAYIGTTDRATLVRVERSGAAKTLYEFPGNEVTAIACSQPTLVVAANEFMRAPLRAAITADSNNGKLKPASTPATGSTPPPGKGKIYRIDASGRVRLVLEDNTRHFTTVAQSPSGELWAGDGVDGRVYSINDDDTFAIIHDSDSRQVLSIDMQSTPYVFATGDSARVGFASDDASKSIWTSKVLDAEFMTTWGELTWRADGKVEFQVRTGNVRVPDDTWSKWSNSIRAPGHVRAERARFAQLRATFSPRSKAKIYGVQLYYLRDNQATRISRVALKSTRGPTTDNSVTPPAQPRSIKDVTWTVDNIDKDSVRYTLDFQGETQTVWRPMHPSDQRITATDFAWETASLADGYYVVRVTATDESSNSGAHAIRTTNESSPIAIDNHPPEVTLKGASRTRISGVVRDALGPIVRLEYAIDGGEWKLANAKDGILDSREEAFEIEVDGLDDGPHVIAVRAIDEGGWVATREAQVSQR